MRKSVSFYRLFVLGALIIAFASGCTSKTVNNHSNMKEENSLKSEMIQVKYNEDMDALEGAGLLFQLDKKKENAYVISHSDMNLEKVEIPSQISYEKKKYPVTKIAKGAFEANQTIIEVIFGTNIQSIDASAFYACPALEQIVLSESVNSIGKEAFAGCNMLKEIQWNQTIKNIGESAFLGCESLEKLTIPGSITQWGAGAFMDCIGLKECIFQEGITVIGAEIFTNCTSLERVTIPKTVTVIGTESFWGCYELSKLSIPDTVVSIGDRAFYSTGITSLRLPANLSEVQMELLEGMDCIEEIRVPKQQKDVYKEVFGDYGVSIKLY